MFYKPNVFEVFVVDIKNQSKYKENNTPWQQRTPNNRIRETPCAGAHNLGAHNLEAYGVEPSLLDIGHHSLDWGPLGRGVM